LEEEIQAYRMDIVRLDEMAAELAKTEFLNETTIAIDENVEPEVGMISNR
jgi:hypothetical protein